MGSSRCWGKVGIARFLRDFQGSVGGGKNLLLVLSGFHAPAFSTAFFCLRDCGSVRLETTHYMRPKTNGDGVVQMLMDDHRASRQRVPKGGLVQLPESVRNGDRVVLIYHPFGLDREDPVQVRSDRGTESRFSFVGGGNSELFIELRNVAVAQKLIGCFHARDLASRSSCGKRPCHVPKLRSERPRAWGEYAGIICMPNSFIALPTCVSRCLSTLSPALTVTKKWLPRSLYNAQNKPFVSITSRNPAITVRVDSSGTNWA